MVFFGISPSPSIENYFRCWLVGMEVPASGEQSRRRLGRYYFYGPIFIHMCCVYYWSNCLWGKSVHLKYLSNLSNIPSLLACFKWRPHVLYGALKPLTPSGQRVLQPHSGHFVIWMTIFFIFRLQTLSRCHTNTPS